MILGLDLTTAILLSAIVTTVCRRWAACGRSWTDIFQLGLVAIGLLAALPFALHGAGGLQASWLHYVAARPDGSSLVPLHRSANGLWTAPAIVSWWDVSLMLVFGGIPWNCHFQRVLSCRTPDKARGHSILAGVMTIAFVVPPLLMGIAAFSYPWPPQTLARLQEHPAETLPLLFADAVPPAIGILGLAAIIGAVTSSFSSSILSAGSMVSWNGLKRLMLPSLTIVQMKRVIRASILLFGAAATLLALKVQSVQALWFFTSDLVYQCSCFRSSSSRCSIRKPIAADRSRPSPCRRSSESAAANRCSACRSWIAYPETVPFRALAARCQFRCCRSSRARRRSGISRAAAHGQRRSIHGADSLVVYPRNYYRAA